MKCCYEGCKEQGEDTELESRHGGSFIRVVVPLCGWHNLFVAGYANEVHRYEICVNNGLRAVSFPGVSTPALPASSIQAITVKRIPQAKPPVPPLSLFAGDQLLAKLG